MMFNVVTYYRFARWLYEHRVPALPVFVNYLVRFLFAAWIPASAKIGKRVKFGYGGLGIVIHGSTQIGDDVVIAQNVTIAGKNGGVPTIGNNVYVGAGAKILGGVTVGTGSIVGANAVVVKDVPARSMVAGVPARIIRENIEISDYEQI
jgi:serine O-acetyltransferase